MKKTVKNIIGPVRPAPNLLVSCRDAEGRNNALAVGFASNVSLNPPMVMVGIVPERFSYPMIKESGEFIINVTPKSYEKEYFYLGTKSGRDEDKFAVMNIAWEDGKKVNAPILTDCPVAIECKVVSSIQPGTHELFFASVEAVHCDEEYLDENGDIDWSKIPLL